MIKWIKLNGESWFFRIMSLFLFLYGMYFLYKENLTGVATTFPIAIVLFFCSILKRLKHFKGLGLEAEFWETKEKEATELIEKLKSIVHLYSHQIIMEKVTSNRFSGARWKNIVQLFEKIKNNHSDLGQLIDFSETKREMDTYFVFDILSKKYGNIKQKMYDYYLMAQKNIIEKHSNAETGSILDNPKYQEEESNLKRIFIPNHVQNQFELTKEKKFATTILDVVNIVQKNKDKYNIGIDFSEEILFLIKMANLEKMNDVQMTDDLIEIADS